MACSLCSQSFSARRHPVCESCAQAAIYPQRVQQVQSLLEREKVHNHAEAILRPGNDGVIAALSVDTDLESITLGTQRQRLLRSAAEQEKSRQLVRNVTEKAAELRAKLEQYKQYRDQQKERCAQRRQNLEHARHQLSLERARFVEPLATSIHKTEQRLERAAHRSVEARAFLCNQVALLLDLKKVKSSSPQDRSQYLLAGLPVPNLRYLCRPSAGIEIRDDSPNRRDHYESTTQPFERITASLEHVSRLVSLCCHYLSIRLPAELNLPHNRTTKTTIFTEKSSYKSTDKIPAPSLKASTTMLSRSHSEKEPNPVRVRALHLDRSPVQLFRDDPKAFQLFVESTMLLAWDIAWLCRSQGLDNINSFEDICAIGRNLHALLFQQPPSNPRPLLAVQPPRPATNSRRPSDDGHRSQATMGLFSHNSGHHNLLSIRGQDLMSGWRFSSPSAITRLIDKLANHFLAEMSQQEWDIVDDHEWDDEREDEQAVLVGGTRKAKSGPLSTGTPHSKAASDKDR